MDKRKAIARLYLEGKSISEITWLLKSLKVPRSTVGWTVKRFKETRDIKNKKRPGQKPTVRTANLIRNTRAKIYRNPHRSISKMAREAQVSRTTMHRIVRDDLKMYPYRFQKRQLLSAGSKEKRLARSKILMAWFKSVTQVSVIYTDEKLFTVQAKLNRQNDRILSRDISQVHIGEKSFFQTQKPASVMVWAGVSSCGKKSPLIFIPEGVKVNQHVYLDMLKSQVLPWIEGEVWEGSYCFQQDGASSHTAKLVQEWCKKNFEHFWAKEDWPPSSPDLNVMDFAMWPILEAKVCHTWYRNVDALKDALVKAWEEVDPEVVRASCARVHQRLKAVKLARGGHIETKDQ